VDIFYSVQDSGKKKMGVLFKRGGEGLQGVSLEKEHPTANTPPQPSPRSLGFYAHLAAWQHAI
jgi:hypothetical protein